MSRAPIFPIAEEPKHYGDYGFHPQNDYFQILEEARRHSKRSHAKPLDTLRSKLQKPISKDDAKSKKRRRWWKSALTFWKRPNSAAADAGDEQVAVHGHRYSYPCRPVSGPIYAIESGGDTATPCRTTSRKVVSGTLMAAEIGGAAAGVAYVSLKDLSVVDDGGKQRRVLPFTAMPIYLVT